MKKIQIKNRFNDSIIYEHESENNTIRETVEKANLYGANLYGAKDESGRLIIKHLTIMGNVNSILWYGNGKISIGCITKTIADWKDQHREIGKENSYTDEQIEEYYSYILFCEQMQNTVKL